MQVDLFSFNQTEKYTCHEEMCNAFKSLNVVVYGVDWFNIPENLKFHIIKGILQVLREYRCKGRIVRYKSFLAEVSQVLGRIVEDQVQIYVDSLIEKGYLKRDAANVIDSTIPLVNEYFHLKSKKNFYYLL